MLKLFSIEFHQWVPVCTESSHGRFAFTTYVKTLIELRSYLRGVSFDKESNLNQLKTLDNIILHMCSLVDAFEQQYKK